MAVAHFFSHTGSEYTRGDTVKLEATMSYFWGSEYLLVSFQIAAMKPVRRFGRYTAMWITSE